jgi:cellulose synthase/poly-beta-1,6-N-acetylglucosamine synthase-like glycosyltransferase
LHSESTLAKTPQIASYARSLEETGLPAPDVRSNDDILPCLSVVVPVYNEAATVVDVIRSVLIQKPVQQLIVMDDASDDNTWSLLLPLAHEGLSIEASEGLASYISTSDLM